VKPIDQTTYGTPLGNCFSACVASILELPIGDVPLFVDENWRSRFLGWLAARGLSATTYALADGDLAPRGFSIAFGPSERIAGWDHACVAFDGAVVHDPHPSREGLPSGVVRYLAIHGPNREVLWFNGG
jgi:hypothetical protein